MSTLELDAQGFDFDRTNTSQESPIQKLRNLFYQMRKSVMGSRGEVVAQDAKVESALPRLSQEAMHTIQPILSKLKNAHFTVYLYRALDPTSRYSISTRNEPLVKEKVSTVVDNLVVQRKVRESEAENVKRYIEVVFEEKRAELTSGKVVPQSELEAREFDQRFGDKIDAIANLSDYSVLAQYRSSPDGFFTQHPEINKNELPEEQVAKIVDKVKQKATERTNVLQDMVKNQIQGEIRVIQSLPALLAYGGLSGYDVGTDMKDPSVDDQTVLKTLTDKLIASGSKYSMDAEAVDPVVSDVMRSYMNRYQQVKNS